VKLKLLYLFIVFQLCFCNNTAAQNVSLYSQFSGRYDFTFVGNTMNTAENNLTSAVVTVTSSSANLNLSSGDTVVKAYLYWAGSGDGDFEVDLNGTTMTPDRTFSHSRIFDTTYTYFSAFKDITSFIQTNGNGNYTLSNLDISPFIPLHYQRRTDFAGWAILIIYENSNLPLNQISVYDGLQGVPNALDIHLTNLYVINNQNAKAGFIAWEGDASLPTETFTINYDGIGNDLLFNNLNPSDNVFNGTNAVTNTSDLYNMDLDIYNIDSYISIGDTTMDFRLASTGDFIMINTVVIKLNSQLPDATVTIDNYSQQCNSREIPLEYTVYNVNSSDRLPAGTQIEIYADGQVIGTNQTTADIPIGGSMNFTQTVTVPSNIPLNFTLSITIDPRSLVAELIELNNTDSETVSLWISPDFNQPDDIVNCNLGFTAAYFDFSAYEETVKTDPLHLVTFHESESDAVLNQNEILNSFNYYAVTTPHQIFARVENEHGCYSVLSFFLRTRNCPPTVYNAVSPNGDGLNDTFFIDGLRDIFVNFKLSVYNRWGRLIWTGDNSVPDWNGYVKESMGNSIAPDGTYFYILNLNDKDYPDALTGYLYLNP